MKHGNATFLSGLHLCLLLLAIFSAVNCRAGNTFSFTATAHGVGYTGAGYIGADGKCYSTLNNYNAGIAGSGHSLVTADGAGVSVGISAPGTYALEVGWGNYGDPWYTVTVSWNGTTATILGPVTLTVQLAVSNNLNRAQTITVGGSASETLAALTSKTMSFVVTGLPGSSVSLSSSPDSLVLDGNPDPLVITQADSTVSRTGHIGTKSATRHVHAVFISYSTSLVSMSGTLDGATIGHVDAQPSSDGITPNSTSYDWNIDLSSDSTFTFVAPSGHSASVQIVQSAAVTNYVVTIDSGATGQAPTSTTNSTTDGTTTIVSTNPTTGTTTIAHSTPTTPTNTTTSPTAIFGGVSTASTGSSGTYNNTSNSASSAAAQDASNSLASIAANTKVVADHVADVQKRASDKNLDGLVQNYTSDASAKASAAISDLQEKANQVKTAASDAHAGKFGSPGPGPGSPANPNPASIELNIGGGMTRTMLLNPFSPDGPVGGIVSKAAALIKRLIAYAIVMFFLREVLKEVRGVVGTAFLTGGYTSQTADMISKVNVFGNSAGVPAAIALRVLMISAILTLVLTFPVAVYAAVESGLPWSELIAVYHGGAQAAASTAGDSALEAAIGWADYVIPWRLMLSTPLYYILIHNALFPLQVFWQAVFKFLP